MVSQWEIDLPKRIIDISCNGTQVASFEVRTHIDATRGIITINDALGRGKLHISHITQTDMSAVRCVNQEIANAGYTAARFRDTPNIHIVGFAISEDIAYFFPCYQSSCRPAHITRLDAVAFRGSQIHLHLNLRDLRLQLDMQI